MSQAIFETYLYKVVFIVYMKFKFNWLLMERRVKEILVIYEESSAELCSIVIWKEELIVMNLWMFSWWNLSKMLKV